MRERTAAFGDTREIDLYCYGVGSSAGISPTVPTMLTTIGPLIGIGLAFVATGMWIDPEATKVPAAQVTNPATKGDWRIDIVPDSTRWLALSEQNSPTKLTE